MAILPFFLPFCTRYDCQSSIVDHVFPPLGADAETPSTHQEFSSFAFWREPILDIRLEEEENKKAVKKGDTPQPEQQQPEQRQPEQEEQQPSREGSPATSSMPKSLTVTVTRTSPDPNSPEE